MYQARRMHVAHRTQHVVEDLDHVRFAKRTLLAVVEEGLEAWRAEIGDDDVFVEGVVVVWQDDVNKLCRMYVARLHSEPAQDLDLSQYGAQVRKLICLELDMFYSDLAT